MSTFLEDLGKDKTTENVANIINTAAANFEIAKKYFKGVSDPTQPGTISIEIPGIRKNIAKRALEGRVLVSRHAQELHSTIIDQR